MVHAYVADVPVLSEENIPQLRGLHESAHFQAAWQARWPILATRQATVEKTGVSQSSRVYFIEARI